MRWIGRPNGSFSHIWWANAHSHRFRNILATELLEQGTTFEEVADILANAPIVRKHYAKWSRTLQERISNLITRAYGDIPDNRTIRRRELPCRLRSSWYRDRAILHVG
jgi:hypothetical protein